MKVWTLASTILIGCIGLYVGLLKEKFDISPNRSRTKIILIILLTVVLYNEYLIYTFTRLLSWPTINCDKSSKCIKILLVADPQILGEQYESRFPRGYLARWDNDRYVARTFDRAVYHVDPNVIVFLGDIMDEGSISKNDEYKRYMERFHNIFYVQRRVKMLYLPGDNDIGGETEPLNVKKLERFQETFKQSDFTQLGHVDMYKVNRLAYSIPKVEKGAKLLQGNRTRIVFSHIPLLFMPSGFVQQVVNQIRPHVIFTAHDHKSLHISADTETGEERLAEMLPPGSGPVWRFQINSAIIHELMVPTCSYRMGVADMGYGAAVLGTGVPKIHACYMKLQSMMRKLVHYKWEPMFYHRDLRPGSTANDAGVAVTHAAFLLHPNALTGL